MLSKALRRNARATLGKLLPASQSQKLSDDVTAIRKMVEDLLGRAGPGTNGETPSQKLVADRHLSQPIRTERIGNAIDAFFLGEGKTSGRLLEIGGRKNPYKERFSSWEYHNLDLSETAPGVIRGDITGCPEIASESFDAIISVDVFEHIDRPWLAAPEICRLLKPGGLTYHSTLFSWRYHPCPIDYWRFTPDALKFLFAELECVQSGFDDLERRRNIIGRGKNKLVADAFGGWRENQRVYFGGRKPRR